MPVIEKFEPYELAGKSWGTETVVAQTDTYMMKVLRMVAGKGGPFQYHERKLESFHLLSGRATVRWKTDDGVIMELPMREGESFHVPVGAKHQVLAETDCVFIEAGLPVFDDRKPA